MGEARRTAMTLANACACSEIESANAGLITTELANNLVKFAKDGQLILHWLSTEHGDCLEILSIDRGPGMKDVGKCLRDGFTTAGTPGNGLGAVQRLSHQFDIFSQVPQGTVIMSRIYRGGMPVMTAPRLQWGVYCRPAPYESVCGDSWRIDASSSRVRLMVADGLGHGPSAAEAAEAAAYTFEQDQTQSPVQFLTAAHQNLIGTRGAAVAVAHVDTENGRVQYAGVGNISGNIVSGEVSRGLFTSNGTVGAQFRKAQLMEYTIPSGALLVMHSDGLQNRWSLTGYPGIQNRHPSVVAATLARDFRRGPDDATILILRIEGKPSDRS